MQQSGSEAIYLRSRMMGKETVSIHLMLDEKTGMDYPHEGSLKFSEVTIDETTGSIALRALIPNPDSLLLPGLFVRAMLDLGQDDVLLVPQRATIRTPEGDLTVWVAAYRYRPGQAGLWLPGIVPDWLLPKCLRLQKIG